MKKKILTKIVVTTIASLLVITIVLCAHIYIVTRPKAPDANTVAMGRIDIQQDLTQADADKIGAWLAQQQGVDRYLCNIKTRIVVFTFHPALRSGNEIAANFAQALPYRANRYMPSAEDMKGGCPVASNSISYKAYSFIKNVF